MPNIFSFKNKRAHKLHEEGQSLSAEGRDEEAIEKYKAAIELDPGKSASYYNIGLIYKYRNDWPNSFKFNRLAYDLDKQDQAARWNLAIAATAMRDWVTARQAWKDNGIALEVTDAPVDLDLGLTPVRLNPDGGAEVVWARRIDLVRARIDSIPFPDSGFRWHDIVLHDGAPEGYRMLGERECAVFNVLELFEASAFSTFQLNVEGVTPAAVESLAKAFDDAGIEMEDWTANVRTLCRQCSEGHPHDHHDDENASVWKPDRAFGIAAMSREAVDAVLHAWREADSSAAALSCVLAIELHGEREGAN